MTDTESSGLRRFSAILPEEYINGLDQLKREWGLRSRGAVLERLLEELFKDEKEISLETDVIDDSKLVENKEVTPLDNTYNENKALVLISKTEIKSVSNQLLDEPPLPKEKITSPSVGIDLPGFVSKRTSKLRKSLGKTNSGNNSGDIHFNTVKEIEVISALKATKDHWFTLYGNKPGENVIEAAMVWLARDIWPQIEGSEDKPFTWTAACKLMSQYCPKFNKSAISLETIIVTAGVLEDPFSSSNLKNRVPTLIRRFVNQFKRRQNINSFQTIESTMTVHGALKLLGMPTQAGSALTLKSIKEAYKNKAMLNHPDSGGSTEVMRKLNEGYQLLKELYKEK